MRLDYWMIYLLIPLVIGILALIAVAPDEIPQPKIHENIIKDAESIETEPQAFTVEMEETISIAAEPPTVPESEEIVEPEIAVAETAEVKIPIGVGVPGCEETMDCYLPNSVTIAVGGTVTWFNDDTAAHTVTSGAPGSDDVGLNFDSSLFLAGASFSHTFEEQGMYDYFCMVHPWMTGVVQVSS